MRANSLNQQNFVLRLFSKVRKNHNNRPVCEMSLDKHLANRRKALRECYPQFLSKVIIYVIARYTAI